MSSTLLSRVWGRNCDAETPMNMLAGRLLWCAAAELALAQNESARALEIRSSGSWQATPGALTGRSPVWSCCAATRSTAAWAARSRQARRHSVSRDEAAWSGARPLLWRSRSRARSHLQAQERDRGKRPHSARATARAIIEELATRVPDDSSPSNSCSPPADRRGASAPGFGSPDAVGDLESPLTKRELEVPLCSPRGSPIVRLASGCISANGPSPPTSGTSWPSSICHRVPRSPPGSRVAAPGLRSDRELSRRLRTHTAPYLTRGFTTQPPAEPSRNYSIPVQPKSSTRTMPGGLARPRMRR